MQYLLLQPDYSILSKYVQFPCSPAEMQQQNLEGYPISMDWFHKDEHYEKLEKEFKALLTTYNLLDHYDNLMLISLSELQRIESSMMAINNDNHYRKGLKELSQLLQAFEKDKDIHLVLKPASTKPIEISDNNLVSWIGKLIKETLESGSYKISDIGFEVEKLFEPARLQRAISTDRLKEASSVKLHDQSKAEKKLVAGFCFFTLIPYLNAETHLRKADGTNFSDEQLRFLHDLLVILELFPKRTFDKALDYEAKDYMRNYLLKYAKGLINKGNQ